MSDIRVTHAGTRIRDLAPANQIACSRVALLIMFPLWYQLPATSYQLGAAPGATTRAAWVERLLSGADRSRRAAAPSRAHCRRTAGRVSCGRRLRWMGGGQREVPARRAG